MAANVSYSHSWECFSGKSCAPNMGVKNFPEISHNIFQKFFQIFCRNFPHILHFRRCPLSVPYQRIIQIKHPPHYNNFLVINYDDIKAALSLLSKSELTLYFHLCMNQDNYTFEYSPAALWNETGISIETLRKAFNKLEKLGFIEKKSGNVYVFRPNGAVIPLDNDVPHKVQINDNNFAAIW